MKRQTFNWKLPKSIEARLGTESYGSQRAIHEDDHLLLVLHEPPRGNASQREHAVFLCTPEGKWLYHGTDNGQHAMARLLDRYQEILADLEKRHETALTAEDFFQVIEAAIPLARAAGNLRDTLQTARETARLDQALIDCRDRAVDIARGMELLLADARLALDYRLARNAEEQVQAALATTRAQQKLNVLAAWTLPLMTISAIFGMNLKNGFEASPVLFFWAVFGGGILLGMAANGWVQRLDTTGGTSRAKNAPTRPGSTLRTRRTGALSR